MHKQIRKQIHRLLQSLGLKCCHVMPHSYYYLLEDLRSPELDARHLVSPSPGLHSTLIYMKLPPVLLIHSTYTLHVYFIYHILTYIYMHADRSFVLSNTSLLLPTYCYQLIVIRSP